jgi:hypothetical protein
MIKPTRLREAWHVSRVGEEEEYIQGFGGIIRRKDPTWKT